MDTALQLREAALRSRKPKTTASPTITPITSPVASPYGGNTKDKEEGELSDEEFNTEHNNNNKLSNTGGNYSNSRFVANSNINAERM